MPAARDKIIAGAQVLLKHHARASVVLYVAGLLGTLLYPLLARRTFIDENAFLLGQTNLGFGWEDARAAEAFASRGLEAVQRRAAEDADGDATDALRAWVASELERLQVDTYVQDFPLPLNVIRQRRQRREGGVGAATSTNATAAKGRNIHGVGRAPRGSGREGIVIATPIGDADATAEADAAALGLGLALFSRLAAAPWLAKDIAWLIPDARWGGPVPGVDAWLKEYHHPSARAVAAGSFGRVGAIQQAYVLELPHGEAPPTLFPFFPPFCFLHEY